MTQIFRAGHLPGLSPDQVSWRDLGQSDPTWQGVQVPVLSEAQIRSITATVREQSALQLRSMSVSEIISRIDAAIHPLLDANDPARQTLDAWLPRVCGLDADVVRLNLNR